LVPNLQIKSHRNHLTVHNIANIHYKTKIHQAHVLNIINKTIINKQMLRLLSSTLPVHEKR